MKLSLEDETEQYGIAMNDKENEFPQADLNTPPIYIVTSIGQSGSDRWVSVFPSGGGTEVESAWPAWAYEAALIAYRQNKQLFLDLIDRNAPPAGSNIRRALATRLSA